VEIKPVLVVKHVEFWQFLFARVVQTHIRGGGQYIFQTVENLSRYYCAKNYWNRL